MTGRVALVGAGPGAPDLLTLRAARLLGAADLVLYDALVSREVLALAPHAQRFCVGKRAGRSGVSQDVIHSSMIRAARRGRNVVRLKCGDPFVLGRGGEEAAALAEAGIPCEVVPGVSSAVAAPALAGIPLTHRGLASGFAVVSGHDPAAFRPILGAIAPHSLTLVILMGLRSRADLAALLVARGWSPETPAAILRGASTPSADVWEGTLDRLAGAALPDSPGDPPGTIVIGAVVGVRHSCRSHTAIDTLLSDPAVQPATAARRKA